MVKISPAKLGAYAPALEHLKVLITYCNDEENLLVVVGRVSLTLLVLAADTQE